MPETQFRNIGDYTILSKLGQGSMGYVFKAEKEGKVYALKIISRKFSTNELMIARFNREIRQSLQLEHPNIIRCLDVGIHDGNNYFYVMEYVDGSTLQQILRKRGSIPFGQALNYIIQIAEALRYASGLNLIHRDIKPENIMIDSQDRAKLFDLGLAKSLDTKSKLTSHGTVVGTPNYMSPEQAEGEAELDVRSDIYSLGATFYHLLTGKPPFEGANPVVIIGNLLKKNPEPIQELNPKIPERICRLVHQMLSKKREERPQINELLAELHGLQSSPVVITNQSEPTTDFNVLLGKQFEYRNSFVLSYREFSFCRYLVVQKILSRNRLKKVLQFSEQYWFTGMKLEFFDFLFHYDLLPKDQLLAHHRRWMDREIENTNELFLDMAFRREVINVEQYQKAKDQLHDLGSRSISRFLFEEGWLSEQTQAYLQGCVWQKRFKNLNTLFIQVAIDQKFITQGQSQKCLLMYDNLIIMGTFRELNEIFIEKGYLESLHVRCLLRALQWNQLFGDNVDTLVQEQRIQDENA